MTRNCYGKDYRRALDKFEKLCKEHNREVYEKNLDNWYIKNYGVTKAELEKRRYRSERYSRWSGNDDGLWFNPNEFYGF